MDVDRRPCKIGRLEPENACLPMVTTGGRAWETAEQLGVGRVNVRFTAHARERMARYEIEASAVRETLKDPDGVVDGHSGRRIAQRGLNGYVLRVVFEGPRDAPVVVTVYRAKRDRYEV